MNDEPIPDDFLEALKEVEGPPQASKLPPEYDTALLGVTVSAIEADRFAYSLKTLIGLVMSERSCHAPEARQIIFAELIRPHGAAIAFINDEVLLGEVADTTPKILIPKRVNGRRWKA